MKKILASMITAALIFTSAGYAANRTRSKQKPKPPVQTTLGPERRAFVQEMVSKHGFDGAELRKLLLAAQKNETILDAISRPAERVTPWYVYRDRFITNKRIGLGADFWNTNRKLFEAAEERGVAPSVIAGILGVETIFGQNKGNFRVLDALVTLGFFYPPRADFFRGELEQFLLLAREENVDPLLIVGSYAGAMGIPQFMPSSYRKYAVDSNGDGRRDLWMSPDDAVGSVANYLLGYGWRAGEPIMAEATLATPGMDMTVFDVKTLALNETVTSLREKGVQFETTLPDDAPALLIIADNRDGPLYRVGFNNFYVITRYNRSTMYAMAVTELGAAIDAAQQQLATASTASQ
jgi:membrane-bound lytic murein transglycosylase B